MPSTHGKSILHFTLQNFQCQHTSLLATDFDDKVFQASGQKKQIYKKNRHK
jgi:hypothetical protein